MTPRNETPTAQTIYEKFSGLIASGVLGAGERLPTVRQTAADFGVSPGTAARAFRELENDRLVVTRVGSGTRVAPGASPLPATVVSRLREIVETAQAADLAVGDVVTALRAIWDEEPASGSEVPRP